MPSSFPRLAAQQDFSQAMLAVDHRLFLLWEDAPHEGIAPSAASRQDLRAFLQNLCAFAPPHVFLLDNGNFRALWKAKDRRQIALQFRGEGIIQHVLMFTGADGALDSAAGRSTAETLMPLLRARDLMGLFLEA